MYQKLQVAVNCINLLSSHHGNFSLLGSHLWEFCLLGSHIGKVSLLGETYETYATRLYKLKEG